MKTCSKCGEEKALEDFYGDRSRKDGRTCACKVCMRAAQATYNVDLERRRKRERQYRKDNPGCDNAKSRRYQNKNRETWLAQRKEYRERNKAELAAKWAAYYAEHSEAVLEQKRQALAEGRQVRIHDPAKRKIHNDRRRARMLDAFVEDVYFDAIVIRDCGVCGICGQPAIDDFPEIDHIIPLAAGGTHEPDNVQLAHRACNRRKGAKANFTLATAA